MEANQYRQLKERGDVLDFATLDATRRILAHRGQMYLTEHITHILSNNRIDKPSLHNTPQECFSDFYRVSLTSEDVAAIVSVLFDYETEVVDINSSAADLTDRWSNLNERTKR